MDLFVADPEWGWWIIAYFYLGGIAAGSYFIAILIEWFGAPEDQGLARIGYLIAFPLVLLCALFLTVDLGRPERFWHMLFKSEVVKAAVAEGFPLSAAGWGLAARAPVLKYWSPMSAGSWLLTLFGACAFASFLGALWPERWPGRWLKKPWLHGPFQVIGCAAGFFIASYTGTLLSATNQPVWSDTTWLASLFLASAASTSLATMTLIAWWKDVGTPEARHRLEKTETLALGLEMVMLGLFVASLDGSLGLVLRTVRGNLLIFGTLLVGLLAPLGFHLRLARLRPWAVPAAAACVLAGGFLLRYGVVTVNGELLARRPDLVGNSTPPSGWRGPALLPHFSPEAGRQHGQPGADPGNHGPKVRPPSKLPEEP